MGNVYYPLENIPFAENRELNSEEITRIDTIRKEFTAEWFGLEISKIIGIKIKIIYLSFNIGLKIYPYKIGTIMVKKNKTLFIRKNIILFYINFGYLFFYFLFCFEK